MYFVVQVTRSFKSQGTDVYRLGYIQTQTPGFPQLKCLCYSRGRDPRQTDTHYIRIVALSLPNRKAFATGFTWRRSLKEWNAWKKNNNNDKKKISTHTERQLDEISFPSDHQNCVKSPWTETSKKVLCVSINNILASYPFFQGYLCQL